MPFKPIFNEKPYTRSSESEEKGEKNDIAKDEMTFHELPLFARASSAKRGKVSVFNRLINTFQNILRRFKA